MRAFLRYFKGLHIWLVVNVLVLALFYLLRSQRGVMNAVSRYFAMPLERALGRLWSLVPFSVAELCYALAFLGLFVFLIRSIALISRAEYKREVFYRRAMGLLNTLLSLYAAFCLLWGVNYYTDDFCDMSGIRAVPVAREELIAVTRFFAEQTALSAEGYAREKDGAYAVDAVERDTDGVYAVPRSESLALAPSLYEGMYEEFPFLRIPVDPMPKGILCSRIMSAMNVTGLYFPFTGESNLNMDFPAALFPATVAHELAHRRGIASEQQCNFLAVLASTRSDDAAYRYSGWLLGYIHLSNALYTVAPEEWGDIREHLPATVIADLRAASDYWAQYDGATARASGKAYDAMLKSYGEELGMQSYGAVVDLLISYYKNLVFPWNTFQK